MENILFGLGLILLVLSWNFILKPTLLDSTRDDLFDLRESVRKTFLDNYGLDHPQYKKLRDYINKNIDYANEISFLKQIFFVAWLESDKDAKKYFSEKIGGYFQSEAGADREIDEIVADVRRRTMEIMTVHMVKNSLTLLSLSLIAWMFIQVYTLLRFLNESLLQKEHSNGAGLKFAAAVGVVISMVGLLNGPFARSIDKRHIEETAIYRKC